MTINAPILQDLITQAIPDAAVEIQDVREDGETHFGVKVISSAFGGKTLVEQHRMVYAALKGHLNHDIHLL